MNISIINTNTILILFYFLSYYHHYRYNHCYLNAYQLCFPSLPKFILLFIVIITRPVYLRLVLNHPALPVEFQKCENLVLSEECYHKDDIINIVNLNFHYFYFQLSQSVEKKRALNQGSHFHLQSISEIKPKSMLPVAQECFFFLSLFLIFYFHF